MAWRRGEIWLDVDVLWFNERSSAHASALVLRAPAFFGLAPASVGAPGLPNGMAESRRRRAEIRRQRHARKTRAAALVVGPAVMLSVAVPRLTAGARAERALPEDPPSSTFRATPGGSGARIPPAAREGAARAIAPEAEPAYAPVHWHSATSHGLPYSGWLSDGTQLPIEGPDWVTWNPVTDSVPNAPRRLYGNERTVRRLIAVVTAFRAAYPEAPRVVVGDISFERGGPMEQHRSHQNGLDVDVYYPRRDGMLRAPVGGAQVDWLLAQDLVDRFVAAGAQKIFVGIGSGLRGPHDVVVPYPNHHDHMHVRFRQPPR